MGVGIQPLFHILLMLLPIILHCDAKGDFEDFEHGTNAISPARIAEFYTETLVQSSGKEEQRCSENVFKSREKAIANGKKPSLGVEPTVGLGAALLIFLGVGVFAVGIAQAFQMVRKYVYHDADNLDTAFDAGGKVSIGLTATTIVSQWTWSATLLQSSTVASKYGISGPYWYAGGATIQIIIFSILSIMLKTRAPGAKTFLQVRTCLLFTEGKSVNLRPNTSNYIWGGTVNKKSNFYFSACTFCWYMSTVSNFNYFDEF